MTFVSMGRGSRVIGGWVGSAERRSHRGACKVLCMGIFVSGFATRRTEPSKAVARLGVSLLEDEN